jgi:hypothetical protein
VAIATIWGPVGSAKSSIALSLPGKKFVFDLERGARRAAWRFDPEEYDLWNPGDDHPELEQQRILDELTYAARDEIKGKSELWKIIVTKFAQVVLSKAYRTIIFDTAKEAWTICHQAFLQEQQKLQLEGVMKRGKLNADDARTMFDNGEVPWRQRLLPVEYSIPNLRMQGLFNLIENAGMNMALIYHQREEYADIVDSRTGKTSSTRTGKLELDGFSHSVKFSDWEFYTFFNEERVDGVVQTNFAFRIDKSPIGLPMKGEKLVGQARPFEAVYNLVMARALPHSSNKVLTLDEGGVPKALAEGKTNKQ